MKSLDKSLAHDERSPAPSWLWLAIVAAIVVSGLLAYSNNLHDGFHFDDSHSITGNGAIQNPTFRGIYANNLYRQVLYWTFAGSWALHGANPVGWHVENNLIHVLNGVLVFWLGLVTLRTPGARGATRWPQLVAGLAALVFVLHPVQTQAVTYITQRTESLAATFYLLALILYGLARLRRLEGRAQGENLAGLPLAAGVAAVLGGAALVIFFPSGTLGVFLAITALGVLGGIGGIVWLASEKRTDLAEGALLTGALAATFLGLETKEIAGTIPLAIVLWELLFTRPPGVCPLRTRPMKEKLRHFAATAPWVTMLVILPFLAVAAGLTVKFMAAENSEEHAPGFSISGGEYFFTQLNVLAMYVRLCLLPYHQTLDYDYPKATSLFAGPAGGPPPIVSLLVLAGLLGLAVRSWERRPLLSWTVLFSLIILVPTSTVFVLPDFVYEHRIYLPLAGAGLLAALVLERLVRRLAGARTPRGDRFAQQIFVAAAVPVLVAFAYLTYARNEVWLNEETLWKDCLAKAPNKPRPKTNLGLHYQNTEPYTFALKPGAEVRLLQGGKAATLTFSKGGDVGGEFVDGDKRGKPGTWVVRPTLDERHSILEVPKASVLSGPLETGGTRKAIALYEDAIAIDKYYFKARNNYALCAVQDGSRLLDQTLDLRRAIQDGGLTDPGAASKRADELAAQATIEFEKAATQLSVIIESRPRDHVAMSNLANLEFQYLDKLDDAIDWMEKSVAINDSAAIVLAVLGEMHYVRAVEEAGKGDTTKALVDLRRALGCYQGYLEKAGVSGDAKTIEHIRFRLRLTEDGIKNGGKLEDPGVGPGQGGTNSFHGGMGPQGTRTGPFQAGPSPGPAATAVALAGGGRTVTVDPAVAPTTTQPVKGPLPSDKSVMPTGREVRKITIIPAYNEELQIGPVIDEIKVKAPGFDVVIIDDGSADRTAEVARAHGAAVVRHPFNMGYGVALQTGYKYAVRMGYDLLVQLDGDGQHDPGYIAPLAARIAEGHSDVCVGTRFKEGLGYIPPFFRRVGMVTFGYIASVATGRRVTDPTSGYQALGRGAFTFFQSDLFPFDYPDADVLILLHRAGFRVEEIPVRMKPSPTGKSMHRGIIKPMFYVFKMFLSIGVTLLREKPRADRVRGEH